MTVIGNDGDGSAKIISNSIKYDLSGTGVIENPVCKYIFVANWAPFIISQKCVPKNR